MNIKIVHLYYDIMNLYGENANVKAIIHYFKKYGIKAEVHFKTINDDIDFKDYDIFYMGMGTEENQLLVLKDMLKRKDKIKQAIEKGKYFFITGNSYELFGSYIIDFNKKKIDTLKIFSYFTKVVDIKNISKQNNFRIVGETSGYTNFLDKKIIGFQNRCGTIYNNNNPLFTLSYGCGNTPKEKTEGFTYKNFYATYLIGPLFIRNPYLTDYFVKKIILEKEKNFKFIEVKEETAEIAYQKYLENFPNY